MEVGPPEFILGRELSISQVRLSIWVTAQYLAVIPAKAGIQLFQVVLDPGFRRGDDARDFLRDHQCSKSPNSVKSIDP